MPQTKTLHIRATSSAVREARLFAAASLHKWGMASLAEDAKLVVSELVTNAVKASADHDDVAVWLWSDGQGVLIEVRDSAPGIPLLIEPTDDELSGRGLPLVAAFSEDWGCCPAGRGKVVWARLCPDTVTPGRRSPIHDGQPANLRLLACGQPSGSSPG